MHLNWRMPLGGALSGVLPNPELSSAVFLQSQIFGRKQIAVVGLDDSQAIEAQQIFAKHVPILQQIFPDDTQAILANRDFGSRVYQPFPTRWPEFKSSTDAGESMHIRSGWQSFYAVQFTNNGSIVNNGIFKVS